MAQSEMDEVTQLNRNLVESESMRKVARYYYGKNDPWCPIEYGQELEQMLWENEPVKEKKTAVKVEWVGIYCEICWR